MKERKILLVGPPQSGKTQKLVDLFLSHLADNPFGERAFIVPDVTEREYLRALLARKSPTKVIFEDEISALPEFLHTLAEKNLVVSGRCLNIAEETLLIQEALKRVDIPRELNIKLSARNYAYLRKIIISLRHSGLFLKRLSSGGNEEVFEKRLSPFETFLHNLAIAYFQILTENSLYDGLFAQEKLVAKLICEQGKGDAIRLPSVLLLDGFYDAYYLYRVAITELSRRASTFAMSLLDIPGDETTRRFLSWAKEKIDASLERIAEVESVHVPLLNEMAGMERKANQSDEAFSLSDFEIENVNVSLHRTHIAEASFIADKILELHQRELVPLDEFLIITRRLEEPFTDILRLECRKRGIPIIIPVTRKGDKPYLAVLRALIHYLAEPNETNRENLLTSIGPFFAKDKQALFKNIYRYSGFIDEELFEFTLNELGEEELVNILKNLESERKSIASLRHLNPSEAVRRTAQVISKALLNSSEIVRKLNAELLVEDELAHIKKLILSISLREGIISKEYKDEKRKFEGLVEIVDSAIEALLNLPPEKTVGSVYLVDAISARQWQKQYVFIAQADASHYPGQISANLTAETLPGLASLYSIPSISELYDFEQSLFLSAITRSKRKTFITLARRDIEGRNQAPSVFVQALFLHSGKKERYERIQPIPHPRRSALREAVKKIRISSSNFFTDENLASGLLVISGKDELEKIFLIGDAHREKPSVTLDNFAMRISSLSASNLSNYRLCPYLFFASYLLRNVEPLESIEELINERKIGTAVHQALRDAFAKFPTALPVGEMLREKLRATVERKRLLGIFDLELERVTNEWAKILERFHKKELQRLRISHQEPKFLELEVSTSFKLLSNIEVKLKGKLDRVDRCKDGSLRVYDYKTGRESSFRQNEAKQLKAMVEVAPMVYLYLLRKTQEGGKWLLPSMNYLLLRELNPHRILIYSKQDGDIWEEFEKAISETIARITSGEFPRAPHFTQECDGCAHFHTCRRDLYFEVEPNFVEATTSPIDITIEQKKWDG